MWRVALLTTLGPECALIVLHVAPDCFTCGADCLHHGASLSWGGLASVTGKHAEFGLAASSLAWPGALASRVGLTRHTLFICVKLENSTCTC